MGWIFDTNPGYRSDAEWRRLLGELVELLSAQTGIHFAPTSWFIDDSPGHANANGCVDIRGHVSQALRLEACAVVCISVNYGEATWVSADILLFSDGRRILGPNGHEVIQYRYTPYGWSDVGWVNGECGEWELGQYPTDVRWHRTQPGVIADR